MKNLKKGFTLIELMVVVAIIGILAATLAPKLREQLAKSKDAKAVALLGSVRTQVAADLVDDSLGSKPGSYAFTPSKILSEKDGIDISGREGFVNATSVAIAIGGSRHTSIGAVAYNGIVGLMGSTTPGGIQKASDIKLSDAMSGYNLQWQPSTSHSSGLPNSYSTAKKKWMKY